MARKKLPPRDSKGRFTSRGRSRSRSRSRSYRKNPPDMVGKLTSGAMGAAQALVGKTAVRVVPGMLGFQKAGNVGMAIQVALALALGWAGDEFVSDELGHYLLIGGLMGPMEQLAVNLQIPMVSDALSGYGGGVGAYVPGPAYDSLGRYVPGNRISERNYDSVMFN